MANYTLDFSGAQINSLLNKINGLVLELVRFNNDGTFPVAVMRSYDYLLVNYCSEDIDPPQNGCVVLRTVKGDLTNAENFGNGFVLIAGEPCPICLTVQDDACGVVFGKTMLSGASLLSIVGIKLPITLPEPVVE